MYPRAIEINPKDADAYNNMGNSNYSLGNYKEAITNYQKALEINPKYADAYYHMGNSNYSLGNYKEAITNY